MTNNDKRVAAMILFGVAIIGSMAANFYGLIGFAALAFPAAPPLVHWLGATVYDAAWLAASYAAITGGAGRWSRIMLVGGVIGAVGANLRLAWVAAEAGGMGWGADAILGHAALPIIGLCAVHGLAHYLSAVPADKPGAGDAGDAKAMPETPRTARATEPRESAPAGRKATPKPTRTATGGGWVAKAQAALDEGLSGAAAARAAGVDAAQVSRALADGRLTRAEHAPAASVNGYGPG